MKHTVKELKSICYKQEIYDSMVIRLTRKVTPYLTWLLLNIGLTANQTTMLGMFLGTLGAVLLSLNTPWYLISGMLLLHLSNFCDYSDGDIARYNAYCAVTKKYDISGVYLDWLWHFYIPTITIFFLSIGAYRLTNELAILIAGFGVVLAFCMFPFSCKEHILIAQLRLFPNLVDNKEFQVAMLDKPQNFQPNDYKSKQSIINIIRNQIAGLVYYPSFFNSLTVIVAADIIYKTYYFRCGYLIVLLILTTGHQIVNIKRTFGVLKNIHYNP